MILCHCHKVTHRHIQKCVEAGACNMKDLKEACGACTGCGGCTQAVEDQLLVSLSSKRNYESKS